MKTAAQAQPNAEQFAALRAYAGIHSGNWRKNLLSAWLNGNYEGFKHSHLLQQVRNTLGPAWLDTFDLPTINTSGDNIAAGMKETP